MKKIVQEISLYKMQYVHLESWLYGSCLWLGNTPRTKSPLLSWPLQTILRWLAISFLHTPPFLQKKEFCGESYTSFVLVLPPVICCNSLYWNCCSGCVWLTSNKPEKDAIERLKNGYLDIHQRKEYKYIALIVALYFVICDSFLRPG